LADTRFTSPLAATLAEDVLERFLRYVQIDTQADPASATYPSSAKQLDLSRLLVEELRAAGLEDAVLSEEGYVFATLPGTAVDAPTVGLIAHVDTAPDAPGQGVKPLVHRSWDGRRIVLPGDPAQMLDPAELPALAARVGHDIVTSDGTTLLGADDKAGVAEILAAVSYLAAHPEAARAPVRIAFTVDEEIGRGTDRFDLGAFGADLAYTLDGSGLGELDVETFSAVQVAVTFVGVAVHPGRAKGRMVNAIKLAADFVASLPRDALTPETTSDREGFVHPQRISGDARETTVWLHARDHDDELLETHVALVRRTAEEVAGGQERAAVRIEVTEQYRNMRPRLEQRPEVIRAAEEAMRRAEVEPVHTIIRGGTDGARLTALGLPTPNLFTGGQDYHSLREWASLQDMAAAAATVVELVRVWAEPERGKATGGRERRSRATRDRSAASRR
jgi:tripeptide aminopeptidase